MTTLGQIQADFQTYLLRHPGTDAAIGMHIADHPGLAVADRLAIYRDGYTRRMRTCLCAAFEKTRFLVGEGLFDTLADGYVSAHPSLHANLGRYGQQFAAYVADTLPDRQYISELAALEWALAEAFDAPDAETVSADDLRVLQPAVWGTLGFALHPSVKVLTLKTNAGAMWKALNSGDAPPDGMHLLAPQAWLAWRMNNQSRTRPLEAFEADALQAMTEGATFGALCERAKPGEDKTDVTLRIARYLGAWLEQGLLSAVHINPTGTVSS